MTNCVTPAELLLLAMPDSRVGVSGVVSDHVRGCGACQKRVADLRKRIAGLSDVHIAFSKHLDDIALAEVADAPRWADLDDSFVAHLARCEPCKSDLAEIVTLLRDPFVVAELDRDEPLPSTVSAASGVRSLTASRARGRQGRIAVAGLAVAAALLLAVRLAPWHRTVAEAPSVIRHATIDIARAPQPVSPVGRVSQVRALTWTSVPRADRYRVSVFDPTGRVVWEDELSDTTVTPPAGVLGQRTGDLRWRVKARTSLDRWIDSDFAEFSLRGDQ